MLVSARAPGWLGLRVPPPLLPKPPTLPRPFRAPPSWWRLGAMATQVPFKVNVGLAAAPLCALEADWKQPVALSARGRVEGVGGEGEACI